MNIIVVDVGNKIIFSSCDKFTLITAARREIQQIDPSIDTLEYVICTESVNKDSGEIFMVNYPMEDVVNKISDISLRLKSADLDENVRLSLAAQLDEISTKYNKGSK